MAKRKNQISADVGEDLRRIMDAAKNRVISDPYAVPPKDADIVRDALRMWARVSPYALDAGELALLLASRAMRKANATNWKGAMRGFAGHATNITGTQALEDQINAFLKSVAESEPLANRSTDHGEVRAARKRKAS